MARTDNLSFSPFLYPSSTTQPGQLAILHVSRDSLVPVVLQRPTGAVDGYAEGAVVNTRFGSFPHSTLLGVPWGSQIRASAVDTGSRGRASREARERKRKRKHEPDSDFGRDPADGLAEGGDAAAAETVKAAVAAASGFVHILRPSPELWTMCLPHRTQVVYTSDYSYILQRIQARPGTQLIEAGAGSGSFAHAAARAVYGGYSPGHHTPGRVWSYEWDRERYTSLRHEIAEHGLQDVIRLTHRNVCRDGFSVDIDRASPAATAVFLDLPAPWEALAHLSRRPGPGPVANPQRQQRQGPEDTGLASASASAALAEAVAVSPLDPTRSVHICTFSPCIEQVTRTIATLRELGWLEIDMVEVTQRRCVIGRAAVAGPTAATQSPGDVAEAVLRLKQINERTALSQQQQQQAAMDRGGASDEEDGDGDGRGAVDKEPAPSVDGVRSDGEEGADAVCATNGGRGGDEPNQPKQPKPQRQGRLQSQSEAQVKTHTSYLVFAVLPRDWTDADEAAAMQRWPCRGDGIVVGLLEKAARKKQKAEMLRSKNAVERRAEPTVSTNISIAQ